MLWQQAYRNCNPSLEKRRDSSNKLLSTGISEFLFVIVFAFFFLIVVLESFPEEFCFGGVGDFVYGSRFGKIEAFGGGFDGADGVDGEIGRASCRGRGQVS